jgi:hypothetical protein
MYSDFVCNYMKNRETENERIKTEKINLGSQDLVSFRETQGQAWVTEIES